MIEGAGGLSWPAVQHATPCPNSRGEERSRTPMRPTEYALRRMLHLYFRFTRGLTLGVRGLVIDGEGRIFLVKHGYVAGWHLPGGGVEPGETIRDALGRELLEEGNIVLTEPPVLHGVFLNPNVSRRDHIACFVVREF